MSAKTIEKLGMQLYAVRQTIKRFQGAEKQIAEELKPLLQPSEKFVSGGLTIELVPVGAHTVPSYNVPEYNQLTVTVA